MATRTQIITRARQKADLVSSTHITSADETDLFQEAFKEVYTLFGQNGMHMIETDQTLSLTAGQATLPSDFYAAIHVWRVDGSDYYELQRMSPDRESAVRSLTGNEGYFYKIRRTSTNTRTINIYPTPSGGTYVLHYLPECPAPGASDAVLEMGQSNTVLVALLAKKFLQKQDEVNGGLDEEVRRLYEQVAKEAEQVEMTQPGRIQDTRGNKVYDEFDFQVWKE